VRPCRVPMASATIGTSDLFSAVKGGGRGRSAALLGRHLTAAGSGDVLHTDVDTLGHDAATDLLVHDHTHGVGGDVAAERGSGEGGWLG
jgi:hypothetical protein